MRLEAGEIQAIRRAAQAVFGAQARVRVFGSRVEDHLKGGDLDLWLEVAPGQATLANELRFRDLIARPLDELKVDVVLHERGQRLSPIDRIARRDGIRRETAGARFRAIAMIRNHLAHLCPRGAGTAAGQPQRRL